MKKALLGTEKGVSTFQMAVLILTIINLCTLVADTCCTLPGEVSGLIHYLDTAVCVVLLADFFVRLYRAENKRAFLKWGWIDLLASIPNLEVLRYGRLVRVLRVIRVLRGIRSLQKVIAMILRNRGEAGAVSLALAAFLMVAFSSVAVLVCERQASSNIKTAEDAVWWSVCTVTTVGYGDKYPVTSAGRIVGMLLMMAGVGMFGGLSGLVASFFVGEQSKIPVETKEIMARLDEIQARLRILSGGEKQ
jgi:voltage-gated potassium channel